MRPMGFLSWSPAKGSIFDLLFSAKTALVSGCSGKQRGYSQTSRLWKSSSKISLGSRRTPENYYWRWTFAIRIIDKPAMCYNTAILQTNNKCTVNRSIISFPRATPSGQLCSQWQRNRFNQWSLSPHGFSTGNKRLECLQVPSKSHAYKVGEWLTRSKIDSRLDTSQASRPLIISIPLSTCGAFTSNHWKKHACAIFSFVPPSS